MYKNMSANMVTSGVITNRSCLLREIALSPIPKHR
jgi:hypothetical protein